jgi:8-oxo-dGTP pyrophosphatase MutT (NUDIX family)
MGVRESRNPRASPGGTPEPFDDGLAATLAREAFEENQVRIGPDPVYLGYQEVHEPGRPAMPRSGWPASSPPSHAPAWLDEHPEHGL